MPSDDPSDHDAALTSDGGELLPWHWAIETLAEEKWCDASIVQACIDRVPNFWDEASGSIREKVSLRYLRELLNSGLFVSSQSFPLHADGRESENVLSSEVLCRLLHKASSLCNPTKGTDKSKEKNRGHSCGHDLQRYILQKASDLPMSSLDLLKKSSVEGHSKLLLSLKESNGLDILNEANNQDCAIGAGREREIQMLKVKKPIAAPHPANLALQEDSSSSRRHLTMLNCVDGDGTEQSHRNIVGNGCENVQLSRHDSLLQISSKENSGPKQAPLNASGVNSNPPLHETRHFTGDRIDIMETKDDEDVDGDCVAPTNLGANADKAAGPSVDLDPMVDDWTEKHLCVKCNKGGPMFSCSDRSCLMVVHEDCLGTLPYFDETGLYYCPTCAYKIATTAYRKAKLKMLQTREALSAFLGRDSIQHKQKGTAAVGVPREVNQPVITIDLEQREASKVSCEGDQGGISRDDLVFRRSDYRTMDDHIESTLLQSHNATVTPTVENVGMNCINEERDVPQECPVVEGNHHGSKQSQNHNAMVTLTTEDGDANCINEERDVPQECLAAEENQHSEPDADNDCRNLPCQGLTSVRTRNEQDVPQESFVAEENQHSEPNADNDRMDLPCQDLSSAQTRNEHKAVAVEGEQHNEDNQDTVNVLRGDEPPETVVGFHVENNTDPGSAASPTSGRHGKRRKLHLEMEKNHPLHVTAKLKDKTEPSSNNRSKRRTQRKRYSNPILPGGRRTALRWTAEEEEILRTAVQKLANHDDGTFPWTKILDFGRHIFHKTRHAGDLKDKWRNMINKEASKRRGR